MKAAVPIVSIVMPMRNAGRYVQKAIASVLSEQEIPLELIVVDDASTDDSAHQVRSVEDDRLRLISGPGRGIAECLNTGLLACRGSIFMRCDADDLFAPARISSQVSWLKRNPHYAAVSGRFSTIDTKDNLISELASGSTEVEITNELQAAEVRTSLCTFAIRMDALHKLGGFRGYFETGEDLDFQLRLGEVGRVYFIPEITYLYRIHTESITHSEASQRRLFYKQMAIQFSKQRSLLGFDDLMQGQPPPVSEAGDTHSAEIHIQGILIGAAWAKYRQRKFLSAIKLGLRGAVVKFTVNGWRNVFTLIFKSLFSQVNATLKR